MIVLSNCLTDKTDEGAIKVANSLIKRIKEKDEKTLIVSYERQSKLTDLYLELNKLLINSKLIRLLRKKETVLYVPFPARSIPTSLRIWILSLLAKGNVKVILAMHHPMHPIAEWLLKCSKAEIYLLSRSVYEEYRKIIGNRAFYLKTGVDTERFKPVDLERKMMLREKYHIQTDKPVILHVGHMKKGRNVEQLLKLSEKYHIILVVSTLTLEEADHSLQEKLCKKNNITVISQYLSNIEEIYQLSDVYFFPVVDQQNCIDVPLSVMEAAAVNLRVVTTSFGELKELYGKEGFFFLENFERETINTIVEHAIHTNADVRNTVLDYDWSIAVKTINNSVKN